MSGHCSSALGILNGKARVDGNRGKLVHNALPTIIAVRWLRRILKMTKRAAYADLNLYYGDIHNHCGLSYGKGTLDEALHNARLQLDFVSVTLHGHWDDMPGDDPSLDYLVDYHRQGFERARTAWPAYLKATDAANQDGRFVTFPSFEWHSMRYGDHCIYFRDAATPDIFHVAHIADLRERLRRHPHPSLLIPHHIGYRQGFRGINWDAFTGEFSPVVEIMSFHGASEHSEAAPEYRHAMGPRDGRSTVQHALERGQVFGFIGSSDHHSAHPGHYGYGQMAVWAESLTRAAIWDAIVQRRVYAITGDRLALVFALNGNPMGRVLPNVRERRIELSVEAASAIDTIEVLHCNRVIQRESVQQAPLDYSRPLKVRLEMGWGELETLFDWHVDLRIERGQLLGIEPHLRGHDIGIPVIDDVTPCVLSHLDYSGGERFRLRTRSPRNASVTSSATQALSLHLRASADTRVRGAINGVEVSLPISELAEGARSFYTGGFVSPSFVFHRAQPQAEYQHTFTLNHVSAGNEREWYYARVRLRNGQWAWSSPIWVEART